MTWECARHRAGTVLAALALLLAVAAFIAAAVAAIVFAALAVFAGALWLWVMT